MTEEILNYRHMAASEAKMALDESLPEEERKIHMDNMLKYNEMYMKLTANEHDYNSPDRERKERNVKIIDALAGPILNLLCYGGVAAFYGYVDSHDCLPGAVLKDVMRKASFKK